jgi:hypothetical protein
VNEFSRAIAAVVTVSLIAKAMSVTALHWQYDFQQKA